MENKYYTPDISEFYVGFEYERKYTSFEEWKKEIYLLHYDCSLNKLNSRITEGVIRVKYLDKEDIESCGFKLASIQPDEGNYMFFKSKMDSVLYSFVTKRAIITIRDDAREEDYTAFVGIINNISEFKQILKMIGVV